MLTDTVSSTRNSASSHHAAARQRIVYVAPDCTDSAVKKRAHIFTRFGHELLSFSFRRDRYNVGSIPDWPNVELGKSTERRLGSRILRVCNAISIIFTRRNAWRQASMIYARNLDLALLALVGKAITGSRAPLVYEVLDIHPMLARQDRCGAVLRWIERCVLKRCQLLVVSSTAFLQHYFQPLQDYRGKVFLLENKWSPESVFRGDRTLHYELAGPQPTWTIGWFGNLRCSKSLEILTELADQLPETVRIYLRGCTSLLPEGAIEQAVTDRTNVTFAGEYDAPSDLASIYAEVHFNWCADFSDGDNSRWLVPNRLYEGGYFGIPAIGIAEHQTGAVICERGLGVSLKAPYCESLKTLLLNMTCDDYRTLRHRIEAIPVEDFVETNDIAEQISALIRDQ